jgi:outer membrane usher protein
LLGRLQQLPADILNQAVQDEHDRLVRLAYTLNLTRRIQFSVNATHVEPRLKPQRWEGFASFTLALGWRTTASSVTSVEENGRPLTTVNMQRSLPLGPGFGFRIDADAQDPHRTQGIFEVQHRRGIIGIRADGADGQQTTTTFNLAGSLVGIGGEVLFSRPVEDGFALVKVPVSRRVRVLANNQTVGRTGRRGSLFVPDLQSYLSSPIGIMQDDVPVDIRLGDTTQNVAVRYRGGTVVRFEAQVIRALIGRLDTGGAPPAYGTLSVTVKDSTFDSPLNADGEFYFEDLPAGTHAGVARWGTHSCQVTLQMPAGTEPITDLGKVSCVEPR